MAWTADGGHGSPAGGRHGAARARHDGGRSDVRLVTNSRLKRDAGRVPSGHSTQRRAHAAVVHCAALGQHGRGHGGDSRRGAVGATERRRLDHVRRTVHIVDIRRRAVQRGEHLLLARRAGRAGDLAAARRRAPGWSACAGCPGGGPGRGGARRRPRRARRPARRRRRRRAPAGWPGTARRTRRRTAAGWPARPACASTLVPLSSTLAGAASARLLGAARAGGCRGTGRRRRRGRAPKPSAGERRCTTSTHCPVGHVGAQPDRPVPGIPLVAPRCTAMPQPPANGGRNSTTSPGSTSTPLRVLAADRPVADQRPSRRRARRPGRCPGAARRPGRTTSARVIGPVDRQRRRRRPRPRPAPPPSSAP